jgi:hypothetical protein
MPKWCGAPDFGALGGNYRDGQMKFELYCLQSSMVALHPLQTSSGRINSY